MQQIFFAQPVLKSASSVNEYSIVYELNGGTNSSVNKDLYTENATVTLAVPTRNGYKFDGWYWDESLKNPIEKNTFSNKKGSLKVYAKWIKQLDLSTFEAENMVEIIPVGSKVTLEDFAGTTGPQDMYAFSISKYEVTQELYQAITRINPSYNKGENLPVESVTWYDAVYFCNELTKMTIGIRNCCYTITEIRKNNNGNIYSAKVTWNQGKKGYRLPTSAEWEMAARGGVQGGWDYKYSGSNNLTDVSWCSSNSNGKIHQVGTKKPNMAGLYDMSGNVSEWCWDTWSGSSSYRFTRGGNINFYDEHSVSSHNKSAPSNYEYYLGFRVCRGLDTSIIARNIVLSNFEKDDMVEIIPKGQKKTLTDFAGRAGSQTISAYSISKYEVTQELYEAVTGTNPSYKKDEKHPVEEVTWYDAVYFCNELTKMTLGEENCCYTITNIVKNGGGNIIEATVSWNQNKKGYRLPTLAEWEMAARGGNKGGWDYKYSGSNNIAEVAWYDGNSNAITHTVGTKKSNNAGLYDMTGNVWEWCWNTWNEDSSIRVNLGGSYYDFDNCCTVTYRNSLNPGYLRDDLGFRVCRSL